MFWKNGDLKRGVALIGAPTSKHSVGLFDPVFSFGLNLSLTEKLQFGPHLCWGFLRHMPSFLLKKESEFAIMGS